MRIFFVRSAEKELLKLDKRLSRGIYQKIRMLGDDPFGMGSKKLAGGKGYRIRLGNYRIVYTVDKSARVITIIKIAHRKEVYS